jgi:hypothetical protein
MTTEPRSLRERLHRLFRVAMVAVLPLVAIAPDSHAQEAALFPIESILVEGASSSAGRIVVGESRLEEGSTYSEADLRDAVARIQRLPFVLSTDFRLGKGSSPGQYVLIIAIRQMKPFFVNAGMNTRWTEDAVFLPGPNGLDQKGLITQRRTNEVAAGMRMFVGAKGLLNVVAQRVEDRNDRYTASFSQYDLFGTNASLTAVASYLRDPGARLRPTFTRFDWHHRDNITWELVGALPIARYDSLRAAWQHGERPIGYLARDPDTGSGWLVMRSLAQTRRELFWIHDSTNDPLFPTSGTRITAGGSRTSMPTSGTFLIGRVKIEELKATAERSWPLTPSQALTLGGSGSDYDQVIREYRAFARYSIDLWGRERTLRDGDLRLEISADRTFTHVQRPPWSTETVVRAGIAYRNVWGVLRLDASYSGGREP